MKINSKNAIEITEDEVKEAIIDWLEKKGYSAKQVHFLQERFGFAGASIHDWIDSIPYQKYKELFA